MEDGLQRGHKVADIVLAENHGWLELEDIAVATLGAHQNVALAKLGDDVLCEQRRRLLRPPVGDQLDADEEASAANVAHHGELFFQRLQRLEHEGAGVEGVLLQALTLDDVEDGVGHRQRDRVAAILETEKKYFGESNRTTTCTLSTQPYRVKVLCANLLKAAGNGGRGDHRRHWMPVAHRLANGDNVRNDVLRLEGPEVRAHSTKADLDLVGDAHAARLPHVLVHLLQVVLRQEHLSAAADHRLADEGGHGATGALRLLDQLLHLVGVQLANRLLAVLVGGELATVGARKWSLNRFGGGDGGGWLV